MEAPESFAVMVRARLLARAADREAEGAPSAGVYRRVADEVSAWWREFHDAPLSLAEAVRGSGYSEQGLRRILRQRGATHFTRATLPVKPEVADRGRPLDDPVRPLDDPKAARRGARRPRAHRVADPLVRAVFGEDQ